MQLSKLGHANCLFVCLVASNSASFSTTLWLFNIGNGPLIDWNCHPDRMSDFDHGTSTVHLVALHLFWRTSVMALICLFQWTFWVEWCDMIWPWVKWSGIIPARTSNHAAQTIIGQSPAITRFYVWYGYHAQVGALYFILMPSGNPTWRAGKWTIEICDVLIKISSHRGFSIETSIYGWFFP